MYQYSLDITKAKKCQYLDDDKANPFAACPFCDAAQYKGKPLTIMYLEVSGKLSFLFLIEIPQKVETFNKHSYTI